MPVSTEENSVIESFARFEGLKELLEEDIEEDQPSAAEICNVSSNHPAFKELYLQLRVAQKKYKAKFVPKVISEVAFNASDSAYPYNDSWLEKCKSDFKKVNKNVVIFLESQNSKTADEPEQKFQTSSASEVTMMLKKINLEKSQVTSSLDESFKRLHSVSELNPNQGVVYSNLQTQLMSVIDDKIYPLVTSLVAKAGADHKEEVEKAVGDFDLFENTEKTRLYSLVQIVAEKISTSTVTGVAAVPTSKGEATYLKKVDPPTFSGLEVDYPEFYRKWLAVVTPARLLDEAEVDRLKEAVPKNVKEMLTGVHKMSKVWEILNKRFGDKELIATKLKHELKSLEFTEKVDHELVIAIAIKVRSIVSRLDSVGGSEALKYDGEFISAIFFQLSDRQKSKWLDFDKTPFPNKWSALLAFLDNAYDKAVQEKLLVTSYSSKTGTKKSVPSVDALVAGVDGSSVDDNSSVKKDLDQTKLEDARRRIGNCVLCNQEHTFKSKWRPYPWPSDRFIQCQKFNDMNCRQRAETLEMYGGCARCTAWGHNKDSCKMPVVDCKEMVGGVRCRRDHSRLVCNSGVAYCLAARTSSQNVFIDIDEHQATLHYMQDISINKGASGRVLWDDGSNRVLVNNTFAKERNLKSRDAVITIKAVNQVKRMNVKIFEFNLVDMYGKLHYIWGYGIDEIIEPDEPVDLSCVRRLFPHVPDPAFQTLPKRRIDILIGLNYNALHPSGGTGPDLVGNLKALRSCCGCGWVIGGCHPDLKVSPIKFSSLAASARIARLSVIPEVNVSPLHVDRNIFYDSSCSHVASFRKVCIDPVLKPEFWESDGMGVLPPRKCPKCRQCAERGECSEAHFQISLKEEAELKLISDNVQIIDGEIHVRYPFIKDPSCLPDNRFAAVRVAKRLWQSLKKDGLLQAYHDEIRKYMERGTFVKLTKEEIASYEGPHQWISHHGVLKSSVSTPLRVVTNSSFDNGGNSLNSCLPKGPNSLNDMNKIMLRFRCYEVAFLFDLSKAYNTMITGLVEKHLRRFVWKFNEEDDWEDYGIDRVHFGDTPAACLLEVSKQKVALLGKEIDPEASEKLVQDSYVDDCASGGTKEAVSRMVGVADENGNYSGTISSILALGGYKVKEFVIIGDQSQPDENLLGNTVFGYVIDPKLGMMYLKLSVNMSRKRRNVRVDSDLTVKDIPSLKDIPMSKRLLLGVTNSFGDFIGIATPFTIRLKLQMKKLFELDNPLSWDESVPDVLRGTWISLITEALETGYLEFPRSVRPLNALGGPQIVAFGDGSFAAFAATVYLVWRTACDCTIRQSCNGHFSSSLLCSKAKVTPLRGMTVPRSELSGGVLMSRLVLTVASALSGLREKPNSAIMLMDSTCTISCLEENAKRLKPFFHNRRGEILENMDEIRKFVPLEEVHYISGELNPADIPTRGDTKLEDIGPSSLWQIGPNFLSLPRDQWPVTRDFVRSSIPDEERRHAKAIVTAAFAAVIVKDPESINIHPTYKVLSSILEYNDSLDSRKRVVALVLRGWKLGKTEEILAAPPSVDELVQAEKLILAHSMLETAQAYHAGKLVSLLPERLGPLIVTRGRLGEVGLERILGVSSLPILVPTSRVAYLYMWRAHRGSSGLFHRSPAQTLAKSRNSVWIIKGKNLAKKVCWQCMSCRKMKKDLTQQQMSLYKDESIQVCPPWTNISLDFAGPVVIKGEVNARSRGKSWILIYVCRNTKAVCLLATAGYSTQDFLMKHEEFVSRKNKPKHIVSDRGSQLVRAGMVLAEKEKPGNWNWSEVIRKNSTTNWVFVPIGSQHRNGLSESQVKVLKRCLHLALSPGTVLKYSELVTLLAKIAHSVNSRPLGLSSVSADSQQEDFLCPITPNQLLLGKTDDTAPPMDYLDDDRLTARLAYVSSVYNTWWAAWHKQVLPTLIPCRKWKTEVRNLQVGDIVHMYYTGSLKDDYRLARVIKTFPDQKGLVRTVVVCYRKRDKRESVAEYKSKPMVEEQVSVQRLYVLLPVSEQSSDAAPQAASALCVRGNDSSL